MSTIYILYHANCHDGFGAAYAAWKKFGDDARYIATSDRVNYPDFIPEGSEVYLLDFTFKKEVILGLREKMSKVVILDHHITSRDDLSGVPDTVFDMDHSGCVITWRYFHEMPVPLFLRYVEDHDIYTRKLPYIDAVTMYSFSLSFDFTVWDSTCELFEKSSRDGILTESSLPVATGRTISSYREIIIDRMISRLLQWKTIAGHRVPVMNTSKEFGGDVCRRMLEQFPKAPFAGYFYETKKGVEWGLRSINFDVAVIAKALGGGGHTHAAGFIRMDDKTNDEISLPG